MLFGTLPLPRRRPVHSMNEGTGTANRPVTPFLRSSSTMIKVFCWTSKESGGLWLDADVLSRRRQQLQEANDILWVDLENPTEEEEALVYKTFFEVHTLTFEDV